jgi:RpiR family transcriptional regulator, carbohydrate utilization regulator
MTKQEPRANGSPVNLAERLENLTSKRQEIVRPILENPREYVLLSVRAMASRLHTDPATIVRIVRGLGFASYRDFQHHLHALSIAFASPLDSMMSTPGDSSIPAVIQESLARSAKNLQALKNSLDAARLAKVAKRLFDARRVVAFAADSAAILAEYLEYHLSIVGLPIVAVTTAGGMTHLARVMKKRDVLIAISFQRGLRQTVEGAQQDFRYVFVAAGSCLRRSVSGFGRSGVVRTFLHGADFVDGCDYRDLRAIQAAADDGGGQGNR